MPVRSNSRCRLTQIREDTIKHKAQIQIVMLLKEQRQLAEKISLRVIPWPSNCVEPRHQLSDTGVSQPSRELITTKFGRTVTC